jgi:predicted MFS family arabinose efflux permease
MGIIIGNRKKQMKYGLTVRNNLIIFCFVYMIMVAAFYLFAETDQLKIYLIILTICSFLLGLVMVNINVPINTVIYRDIEKEQLAKVNSLTSVGSMGLTPVAASLGGVLINNFGLGTLYVICGLGFFVTTVFISLNKKTVQL